MRLVPLGSGSILMRKGSMRAAGPATLSTGLVRGLTKLLK